MGKDRRAERGIEFRRTRERRVNEIIEELKTFFYYAFIYAVFIFCEITGRTSFTLFEISRNIWRFFWLILTYQRVGGEGWMDGPLFISSRFRSEILLFLILFRRKRSFYLF
jgi:hypothetical protein